MSYKTTKRKLNKIFSEFIRLRDSNQCGVGQCISCGKFINVWRKVDEIKFNQQAHAGHYYSRGTSKSLYFDEKNVNLQCVQCNTFREGNKQGYAQGLIRKYGEGILDFLEVKSKNESYLSENELGLLIREYEYKVKQLKEML
jgi:hypothetical protein